MSYIPFYSFLILSCKIKLLFFINHKGVGMDTINYEVIEALNVPHKEEINALDLSWFLLHEYMIY